MTKDEIQKWQDKLGKMSHIELAELHRFAPIGHPVFASDLPLRVCFNKAFEKFGGMTSEISKTIGWGNGKDRKYHMDG